MRAVITAAGLGTRFLPVTKAIPKELLPVLDKPAIQYVVEEALDSAAQAEAVLIVTNSSKPAIQAHFQPDPQLERQLIAAGKTQLAAGVRTVGALPVEFAFQAEPGGLGQAVACAGDWLRTAPRPQEPFYVLLADALVPSATVLPRLLATSRAHNGASVLAVLPVALEETRRFGVIAGESLAAAGEEGVWQVRGLVEKPQDSPPSNLAVFGRYLLSPRILDILEHTAPGVAGEIQLTDALVSLLAEEEIYAVEMDPEEGFDVGTSSEWLRTNLRLAARTAAYQDLF
ncbi:MAG: sugar phosphate nucleotidyltransferase [Actinomycetia bacterium]|nr:sugar phosphate nucleotidyltransferase [Actinomycetes bacterium]